MPILYLFVLEQPNPHLLCSQEVYLKNSVDCELVRGDVKCLDWNEIIKTPCPVSSLNEGLLRVIRGRVPKRTIVVRTEGKSWSDGLCVFTHRAKQRAYRV